MSPARRPARTGLASLALGVLAAFAQPARAQTDDDLVPSQRTFTSPERFTTEFRIGPYTPDLGNNDAFDEFFADDSGLLLEIELDVIAYRLPNILYVAGAGGIGWANYEGHTRDQADFDTETSEETTFEVIPLNLLAVLRIDALSRQLGIPFNFAGKLGYQWMHWDAESGGSDDADGWSQGVLWAGQVALDLDTFEPRQARMLDEEWGINHSFLFFEIFGFEPGGSSLEIGDTTWTAGLGFVF